MAMAIFEVTLVGGEVARMRADFAQAACNIEYQCGDAVGSDEWSSSQYQVADARHSDGQAVELVFAVDGDEVESYSELDAQPDLSAAIKVVRKCQARSSNAWDMAVETAGPEYSGGSAEKAESMQESADACDAAYDAAIEALESGDVGAAREALETAKTLESEGGDDSDAITALEALGE